MIIPTLVYGYLFFKLDFPLTERVASAVPTSEMYKAVVSPLFIFMFICMFGTAVTELFTGQWIDVLLRSVTSNALLILTITSGVMVIGRAFAGPVVHRLAPQGVLVISSILAAIGIYLLGHTTGNTLFLGALVFGMGVCYFWPTMLGFVNEYIPKSGALGLNLMGGAGMFAVSIYTIFMGSKYDELLASHLPAGASLADYAGAAPGSEQAAAFLAAQRAAGPEVLDLTLVVPILLTAAFIGLYLYMRGKPRPDIMQQGD
jgi:MFS family permease